MSAKIKIDQAGLGAGVAGKSRTDGLSNGALVTLTNTSLSPNTTFRLLWTPENDTTAVSSLAATGSPHIWTFTPTAAAFGTYLIELIENQGLTNETRERRVLRVRLTVSGLAIPALNEVGDPRASLVLAGTAQIEASDDNADDYADPDLNTRRYAGWWRLIAELCYAVESGIGGGGGGSGDFVGPAGATDNALVRFNGTTGKLGQNSLVTLSDTGVMDFGGGNKVIGTNVEALSSAETNTTFVLRPDGAGGVVFSSEVVGANDPNAIHDNITGEIAAVALKNTPIGSDLALIEDSAAGNAKKRVTLASIAALAEGGGGGADPDAIHDNVSGEIAAVAQKDTPTGTDLALIEDAAAGFAKKRVTLSSIAALATATNHNTLSNLTVGDVHTHYWNINGRSGTQVYSGSSSSGGSLVIQASSAGAKGAITLLGSLVDVALKKIINLADPTDNQDAATKIYVDNRPTGFHASTHIRGGSDQIDGDLLDVDYVPTNYNRATSGGITSLEHLAAHLLGISNKFGSVDIAIAGKAPLSHAPTHIRGGSDQIDGDLIDVDVVPVGYTRVVSSPATNAEHLAAHLHGIGSALVGKASTSHAPTHISTGSDPVDGDRIHIDYVPYNGAYVLDTNFTGGAYNVADQLSAHLNGIARMLSTLKNFHGLGPV